MSRAFWTSSAEQELEEIVLYIREEAGRPETGRRIGEEVRDHVDRLANRSSPHHIHPAAPPGWFYTRFKRWLIFYQPHPDGIEVMRIADAARDLPSLFNE
jgi:plasmid stabilization system protein ParE